MFDNEFVRRLKGCYNILFNHHKFIGMPDQNCPCYDKYGNQIGFFSNSNTVVTFAFVKDNDKWYVLANQRGDGTPDVKYRGCWNCSCGYVDRHESRIHAALREVKEETGVTIDIPLTKWREVDFPDAEECDRNAREGGNNDELYTDARENLIYCYYCILPNPKSYYELQFSHKWNEKDEVKDIKFIPVDEVNNYDWAFHHENLISGALEYAIGTNGK